MESLLEFILWFLIEVLGEAISSLPVDLLLGGYEEDRNEHRLRVALTFVGGFVGGLSVVLLPATFLHHSSFRIFNIIASPLLAGWMARSLSKAAAKEAKANHFWRAFCFVFGLALIRFIYGKHGG